MRGVSYCRFSTFFRLLAFGCALSLACGLPAEAAKKAPPPKKVAVKTVKKQKAPKAQPGYAPPYASLVVDAKTGKVLFADNADETRHPASLTKVMTLYVLFEELDRGTLTLKTPLTVSAEASRQAPSKLGLLPGDTITVEDAIKALVTKSANDVAVAIAENISGSEPAFAQRMTRMARALGMNSTAYYNASGLPDPRQVTTARDLVRLGRAIQDNHPNYYRYFSTRSFAWRGQVYPNHNKLLGSVQGVDGIKTGYVRASGFNLLTSARQDGRQVVAVVLGGRSANTRDAHMRELIAENLPRASAGPRTAPLIAEAPIPAAPVPTLMAARASAAAVPVPHPVPRPMDNAANSTEEPNDIAAPVMAAMAASAPAAIEETSAVPQPAAAEQAAPVRNSTMTPDAIAHRIAVANDLAGGTTTPPAMRWTIGAQPAVSSSVSAYAGTTPGSPGPRPEPIAAKPAPVAVAAAPAPVITPQMPVEASLAPLHPAPFAIAAPEPVAVPEPAPSPSRQEAAAIAVSTPPRPGWMIQIAATPDQAQAQMMIERASGAVKSIDRSAEGFTEPVEKDGVTLYRARFAGFSERGAAAACKAVKRASFSCFTLKN